MEIEPRYTKVNISYYLAKCLNKIGPNPVNLESNYFNMYWTMEVAYNYKTFEDQNLIQKLLRRPALKSITICRPVNRGNNNYIRIDIREFQKKFGEKITGILIDNIKKLVEHYNNYYEDEDYKLEMYRGMDLIECPPNI